MLSYTFINSLSQMRDPGAEGPLVEVKVQYNEHIPRLVKVFRGFPVFKDFDVDFP